jgi:hypothetical protein
MSDDLERGYERGWDEAESFIYARTGCRGRRFRRRSRRLRTGSSEAAGGVGCTDAGVGHPSSCSAGVQSLVSNRNRNPAIRSSSKAPVDVPAEVPAVQLRVELGGRVPMAPDPVAAERPGASPDPALPHLTSGGARFPTKHARAGPP